jgi:hypothetical protein
MHLIGLTVGSLVILKADFFLSGSTYLTSKIGFLLKMAVLGLGKQLFFI